jgi:hypothetical protein
MSDAINPHVQAERCFRLARGPIGPRIADELEALGRAFEQEARELEIVDGWDQAYMKGDSRSPRP